MNTFFDNSFNRNIVTIYPGEYYVSKGPEFISTILGSCVAIVLFDPKNLIGGINHFMLAKPGSKDKLSEKNGPIGRFGEYAIDLLLKEMEKCGAERCNLQAKIFGGSNVFNLPETSHEQVGAENIRFAKTYLAKLNIPIVAEDLGGVPSRKIIFDPSTFKVLLKRISQDKSDS